MLFSQAYKPKLAEWEEGREHGRFEAQLFGKVTKEKIVDLEEENASQPIETDVEMPTTHEEVDSNESEISEIDQSQADKLDEDKIEAVVVSKEDAYKYSEATAFKENHSVEVKTNAPNTSENSPVLVPDFSAITLTCRYLNGAKTERKAPLYPNALLYTEKLENTLATNKLKGTPIHKKADISPATEIVIDTQQKSLELYDRLEDFKTEEEIGVFTDRQQNLTKSYDLYQKYTDGKNSDNKKEVILEKSYLHPAVKKCTAEEVPLQKKQQTQIAIDNSPEIDAQIVIQPTKSASLSAFPKQKPDVESVTEKYKETDDLPKKDTEEVSVASQSASDFNENSIDNKKTADDYLLESDRPKPQPEKVTIELPQKKSEEEVVKTDFGLMGQSTGMVDKTKLENREEKPFENHQPKKGELNFKMQENLQPKIIKEIKTYHTSVEDGQNEYAANLHKKTSNFTELQIKKKEELESKAATENAESALPKQMHDMFQQFEAKMIKAQITEKPK